MGNWTYSDYLSSMFNKANKLIIREHSCQAVGDDGWTGVGNVTYCALQEHPGTRPNHRQPFVGASVTGRIISLLLLTLRVLDAPITTTD